MSDHTFTITVAHDTRCDRTINSIGFDETRVAMLNLKREYEDKGIPASIWATPDRPYHGQVHDRATGKLLAEGRFATQKQYDKFAEPWRTDTTGAVRIAPDGKPTVDDNDVWRCSITLNLIKAPKLPRSRKPRMTRHVGYISPLAGIMSPRRARANQPA